MPIAPRTYWTHVGRPPSKRALWDMSITEILAGYYTPDEWSRRPPESLYGSLKMWTHLQRLGVPVTRCIIERLMRNHGWRGTMRARQVRTPSQVSVSLSQTRICPRIRVLLIRVRAR
jgi:putative transposase